MSADRSVDEASGQAYFLTRIVLPPEQRERLGDTILTPGMPAEVFIQTRARSVLDYLVEPLFNAANVAFTES